MSQMPLAGRALINAAIQVWQILGIVHLERPVANVQDRLVGKASSRSTRQVNVGVRARERACQRQAPSTGLMIVLERYQDSGRART